MGEGLRDRHILAATQLSASPVGRRLRIKGQPSRAERPRAPSAGSGRCWSAGVLLGPTGVKLPGWTRTPETALFLQNESLWSIFDSVGVGITDRRCHPCPCPPSVPVAPGGCKHPSHSGPPCPGWSQRLDRSTCGSSRPTRVCTEPSTAPAAAVGGVGPARGDARRGAGGGQYGGFVFT